MAIADQLQQANPQSPPSQAASSYDAEPAHVEEQRLEEGVLTKEKTEMSTTSESEYLSGTGTSVDEPRSAGCALTFKDVSFSIRAGFRSSKETVVLSPVSGHFEPGTLAAIMGPSGSGKTTLVDILADKKTARYSGTVYLNGRPRGNLSQRLAAYVPQNDVMPAHLTVQEAVNFHCALKQEWPHGFSKETVNRLTDKNLRLLGLDEVRDSRIGDERVRGISGGQRRRLALARGLSSGARLIFCDEPTSGLSATDAESCVRYMRLVADRYRVTIVVVIHQPRVEVAELFDHLLLLTTSPGRAVYNGPMSQAVQHFEAVVGKPMPEQMNPMDYCMDLVTPGARGSCPELCVEYYNTHCKSVSSAHLSCDMAQPEISGSTASPLPIRSSRYAASFPRQCRLVLARHLKLVLRDEQGVIADLLGAVAKALIVGAAYLNVGKLYPHQQCGFFFMLLMSCSVEGMKNMPKIIGDRTIMKMETAEALYNEWAYIIAFTLVNWIQTIVSNALFVVVIFFMSGMDWRIFGDVFLWTTLVAVTMDSMFLMIAAISKDATMSIVLVTPFFLVFLLYNGFTCSKTTVPGCMQWAIAISPVAHGLEALVIAASKVYPDYEIILGVFGYEDNPLAAYKVMGACFVAFRTVQILCLSKLNNIQR